MEKEEVDVNIFMEKIKAMRQEKFNSLPEDAKNIVNVFNGLSSKDKKAILSFLHCDDREEMENPPLTQTEVQQIHKDIFDIIISYLRDYKDVGIDTLSLSIDEVNESCILNMPSPYTDTSLVLGHYNEEGKEEIIGCSM